MGYSTYLGEFASERAIAIDASHLASVRFYAEISAHPAAPPAPGPALHQATSRIDHRMKDKDGKLRRRSPRTSPSSTPSVSPGSPPAKLSCIEAPINATQVAAGRALHVHACACISIGSCKPVWKHATEDLCLVGQDTDGEHSWAVARFTTSDSSRMQLCMRVNVADKTKLPCGKRPTVE